MSKPTPPQHPQQMHRCYTTQDQPPAVLSPPPHHHQHHHHHMNNIPPQHFDPYGNAPTGAFYRVSSRGRGPRPYSYNNSKDSSNSNINNCGGIPPGRWELQHQHQHQYHQHQHQHHQQQQQQHHHGVQPPQQQAGMTMASNLLYSPYYIQCPSSLPSLPQQQQQQQQQLPQLQQLQQQLQYQQQHQQQHVLRLINQQHHIDVLKECIDVLQQKGQKKKGEDLLLQD
jgi:hypothetical protein